MDSLVLASILSMTGLAVLFSLVLSVADKKLKVKENPKIGLVYEFLPHVNCAACGYISCHDFAENIVTGGEDPGKCRVLGEEAQEALFKFLGKEAGDHYPVMPLVECAAGWENKKIVSEYKGVRTCRAADIAFGGGMPCEYGCMGFGDCTMVCPFDALWMEDGLPKLDQKKCTGCGKCVEACPRNIISMQEKKNETLFYVACSSFDDARRVREVCGVGCISCSICEKLSPEKLFIITDNLSRADYLKQGKKRYEMLQKITAKCPTKVIKEV